MERKKLEYLIDSEFLLKKCESIVKTSNFKKNENDFLELHTYLTDWGKYFFLQCEVAEEKGEKIWNRNLSKKCIEISQLIWEKYQAINKNTEQEKEENSLEKS